MTRRYTGGFLSAKEQISDANTANGIYSITDAQQLTAQGNFPTGRWTPSRSIRIRNNNSAYLYRTPTVTATSNQKFTISAWVKRPIPGVNSGAVDCWYAVRMTGSQYFYIGFGSDDTLNVMEAVSSIQWFLNPTRRYRDPAAWYHIVLSVDTTQAIPQNRVKIYTNGVQETSFGTATYPSQNYNHTYIGSTSYIHSIGWAGNNGVYSGANLSVSELVYVDGQALDASYFGATDPETAVWIPKQYTGTYGAQGFYLPFSNTGSVNALGLDMSPSKNISLYSEQFDNAAWSKTNVTVTANAVNDPINATTTADKVIPSATNATHIIQQSLSGVVQPSTYYTFAIYAKAAGYNEIEIAEANTTGSYGYFNLTNGVLIGSAGSNNQSLYDTSASIQNIGNGWYRCIVTLKTGSSQTSISPTIYLGNNGTYTYAGDTTSGIYFWGSQINAGKFANTYATTTSAGVTNDWTPSGVSLTSGITYDSLVDVPGIASITSQTDIGGVQVGNYPILNSLSNNGNTLTNGNLTVTGSGASYKGVTTTMGIPSSGKFYWEFKTGVTGDVLFAGIGPASYVTSSYALTNNSANDTNQPTPGIYSNTSSSKLVYVAGGGGTGVSSTDGDLWMFAYDADTGKYYNGINGIWYSNPGGVTTAGGSNPSAGTGPVTTVTPKAGDIFMPYAFTYNTTGGTFNFGQQPFVYTPPSGFKSLCTTTLTTPVIKVPSTQFDIKTWGGTGTYQNIGVVNKEVVNTRISNSLRFRGSLASRSPLLWRSYATSGTGGSQKWTYSVWVKKGHMSSEKGVLLWGSVNSAGTNADNSNTGLLWETNGTLAVEGQNTNWLVTSQAYNDKTNWHNIVLACDTTQNNATDRLRLYFDGVRITTFSTYNALTLNQTTGWGLASNIHQIGSRYSQEDLPFDGFMAEANFIDGLQLTPSAFGQFDSYNNWVPSKYSGSYGTNGWYLPFTPPSAATAGTSTYAGYFDGSTQYLTTPSNSNLALGSGTFTVEFWMNLRSDSNNNLPVVSQDYSTGLDIRTGESGSNQLGFYINNSWIYGFYPTVWRDQWQHIAIVRNASNVVTLYVNGSPICSTTNSANLTAQQFRIGQLISGGVSGSGLFAGSISNLRVVKGTAVYTGQFTPPTGPLTAISGTQLLALQSATPTADASSNNFTLTNTASVVTDIAYPMAKTVGVDASGNGNDLNPSYILSVPVSAPTVLTYGTPGTYTWVAPAGVTSVKALVIAGGGGGGGNGGGGGAGGMIYNSAVSVTPGTSYTVTVGAGGRGGNGYNGSLNGQNSVFGSLTAIGGGRGGCYAIHAAGNGGSGGGGVLNNNTPGTGTAGQGNAGGSGNNGNSGNTYYHGGGGGAGSAGTAGGSGAGGGAGLLNNITGIQKWYAGGGGGIYFITNSQYAGAGGLGGGGTGNSGIYSAGTPNTGGGGGANGANTGIFSSGGSGVVILSYTNANTYTGPGANLLDTHDIFTDTPTEYDATTDGIDIGGVVRASYPKFNGSMALYSALPTFGDGGLTTYSNTGAYQFAIADMPVSNGKWYWEFTVLNDGSSGDYAGILDYSDINYLTQNNNIPAGSSGAPRGFFVNPGGVGGGNYGIGYLGQSFNPSPGLYWEHGDVIQFAMDTDKKLMYIGKNGTWVQSQVPASGTNGFPFGGNGPFYPYAGVYDHPSLGSYGYRANFGQKQFVYTPPTGFKSINSKNLKDVGSYNLPDTTGNFVNTPDLAIMKARNNGSYRWQAVDTVRGGRNVLFPSDNTAAGTYETVMSFNPGGVTLGSEAGINGIGYSNVGWFWNRGTTPGFDIVSFGSTGAAQQIPHNCGGVPRLIITKLYQASTSWATYHASIGATGAVQLQSTAVTSTGIDWFRDTAPTSTHFTIGANYPNAYNGVAYCWAEVPGFSKFGTWNNNNSTDGTFVYLGFRPACILIKNTDNVECWYMEDSKRRTFNIAAGTDVNHLQVNSTSAEGSLNASTATIDFLSNGFKIRTTNAGSGEISFGTRNYVYGAWAEAPFKYANAR